MSGLDLMRAMLAGKLPPPSIALTMPLVGEEAHSGYMRFTATPDQRHLNPMGGVHGGFAATVLDSATGCAVHSALEPGFLYSTLDLSVKMLRPLQVGVPLRVEGRLLHRGRNFALSEGQIFDPDGRLLAHATSTCAVFRLDERPGGGATGT